MYGNGSVPAGTWCASTSRASMGTRTMEKKRRVLPVGVLMWILVFATAVGLACGGGGRGGGGTVPAPSCLEFTPSGVPAQGSIVTREGAGSTCDDLVIDVVVTDVTDL